MGQHLLRDLAFFFLVWKGKLKLIDFDDIVDTFASLKARKNIFYTDYIFVKSKFENIT